MSGLQNTRPNPTVYTENGHGTALRRGKAFIFDAHIVGLAAAASVIIRFVTGDSAVIFESGDIVINQEEVEFEVYEDTVFTSPGNVNTTFIRNMNRLSTNPTELVVYDTPVVNTIGELVVHQLAIGAAGQNVNNPGFGGGKGDVSFVLKPNTEHLFKVTNNSVLPVTLEAHYFFHEANAKEYTSPS